MDTLRELRVADRPLDGAGPRSTVLDPTALVGTWYATDPAADGVVRMVLRADGDRLLVRAFGAGEPEYDWGEIEAVAYGAGVDAQAAMAFSAEYRFPFVTVVLAAYGKQGILVLDTFNSFTDDSGRANYFSREFFHR